MVRKGELAMERFGERAKIPLGGMVRKRWSEKAKLRDGIGMKKWGKGRINEYQVKEFRETQYSNLL